MILWLSPEITVEGGMFFIIFLVVAAKTIMDSKVTLVPPESSVIISIIFGIVTDVGVIVVRESRTVVVVQFIVEGGAVIRRLEVST